MCAERMKLESAGLEVFSKMEYVFDCPKQTNSHSHTHSHTHPLHGVAFNETIEPLAGFLRDSTPVCYGAQKSRRSGRQVHLEDKDYIIFSDLKCTMHRVRQQQRQQQQRRSGTSGTSGSEGSSEGSSGVAARGADTDTTRRKASGTSGSEGSSEGSSGVTARARGVHTHTHTDTDDTYTTRRKAYSPRLLIVDLGATLWYWSLSGPSQKYLLDKYTRSGYTNLYRFLAYEANVYPKAKKIFQGVPATVMPHYQYFNVPITHEVGSKYNPLTMIRALAKPRDFVSVKLDVDNSEIEFSLIEQILSDPLTYSLIDEFFFEHHSNVKEFQWAWKEQVRGSMADGYKFFRRMRELGIRAHSWI